MCSVSMIGDHYRDKWTNPASPVYPSVPAWPPVPGSLYPGQTVEFQPVGRAEFDHLKREVAEMKELLKRAKKYDEDNGEPNCEIDDKMEFLRNVAKLVGIDLDDVIGKAGPK